MKRLKSPAPAESALHTISYFAFFGYPPDLEEIFTFFPEKTGKKRLQTLLDGLVSRKKLLKSGIPPGRTSAVDLKTMPRAGRKHNKEHDDALEYQPELRILTGKNSPLYTLPQYSIHIRNRALRREITRKKLAGIRRYLHALSRSPFIRLAGISGSASMGNCKPGDDVDLCIVSARNRLFLARFWAILLAIIFGLRQGSGSVCLNLFFDEGDLEVPDAKKNYYVAHEVLQMKPVVNKNFTWERFLYANRWVYGFFPNAPLRARKPAKMKKPGPGIWGPLEQALGALQIAIIRKNKTGFLTSPTQLWLFKKDFQKRAPSGPRPQHPAGKTG